MRGMLYQSAGAVATFRWASAFALLGLVVFVGAQVRTDSRLFKRA